MKSKMNRPSFTAFVVISSLLALRNVARFRALVPEDAAALYAVFYKELRRGSPMLALLSRLPDALKLFLLNRILAEGAPLHYALRKQCIERYAQQAIAEGITQIVNLGAGFDVLLLRLARRHADLRCIELDLPTTQASKRAILEQHAAPLPENLYFLPCDMAKTPLDEALAAFPAFSSHLPTLFVFEGVSMYLSAEENRLLLARIAASCRAETRLVFTAASPPTVRHHARATLRNVVLARSRESFRWLIPLQNMEAFMQDTPFSLKATHSYGQLQKDFHPPENISLLDSQLAEHVFFATVQK